MSREDILKNKMKNVKFLTIAILIIGASSLSSCKKEGCTNTDADNYDAQAEKSGTCYLRYGNEVAVITPNSVNYDPLDAPDLFIRFAKSASSQWDYTSPVVNNSYSFTANFNAAEFLLTNEKWEYEIYDQDTFDSDDLVCSGSFNPLTDGSDGIIVIFDDGVEIQFKYSVKI
jgi:hypothetical protein